MACHLFDIKSYYLNQWWHTLIRTLRNICRMYFCNYGKYSTGSSTYGPWVRTYSKLFSCKSVLTVCTYRAQSNEICTYGRVSRGSLQRVLSYGLLYLWTVEYDQCLGCDLIRSYRERHMSRSYYNCRLSFWLWSLRIVLTHRGLNVSSWKEKSCQEVNDVSTRGNPPPAENIH